MKYYFFEMRNKDEKIPDADLNDMSIADMERSAAYDFECDDEEGAINAIAQQIDDNNEEKQMEDYYHYAVVNEKKEVKYILIEASFSRDDASWRFQK